MKVTIIVDDKAVYLNSLSYDKLEWEGTPSNVHALQWDIDSGWIEFKDNSGNETINELPQWALNAVASWNEYHNRPEPIPEPEPEVIEPTKEELLAQLEELTAKINSL